MGMWRGGGGNRQFLDPWPEHSSPSAESHTASVNGGGSKARIIQTSLYFTTSYSLDATPGRCS